MRDHRGQRWKKRKLNGMEPTGPSGPASSGPSGSDHSVSHEVQPKGNKGFPSQHTVTFDGSNPVKDIKNLVSNSKSNIARIPAVLQTLREKEKDSARNVPSGNAGNVSSLVKKTSYPLLTCCCICESAPIMLCAT